MRSVSYRLADLIKARIPLGFVGENEHTVVQFDAKQAFDQYPTATPSLTVKNPSGEKYPAVVVRDGDMVIWTISDSDLIVPGHGEFQLQFKEGDTVMRSYVGETRIERSIMPTGDVPTPVQNWIDQATDVLEEVEEAIPAGGTTGQVLAKASDADRDLEWVDQTGGGGGTSNYNDLSNKPQIGGVTLSGNKTLHDLGAAAEEDIPVVHNVPAGGSANQVLAKNSGTDYDLKWVNQSGGGGGAEIDDTAGEGDTDVVWSADKTWTETEALKEAIGNLETTQSMTWEVGVINSSTGKDSTSTTRIRTIGFIDFDDLISMKVTNDKRINIFAYNSLHNYIGNTDWLAKNEVKTKAQLVTAFPTIAFMRVIMMATSATDGQYFSFKANEGNMVTSKWREEVTAKCDTKYRFDEKFLVIAYSSISGGPPINTKEHFAYCAEHGFDGLKTDVRITSDNKIILCHDAGFTFDQNGRIANYNASNNTPIHDLTYAECVALEYAQEYQGGYCHPCGIDDFMIICKRKGKIPFITIRDEYVSDVATLVADALNKYAMTRNCIINSFTHSSLLAVRNLVPDAFLSLVFSPYNASLRSQSLGYAMAYKDYALSLFYADGTNTLATMLANNDVLNFIGSCIDSGIRIFGAQSQTDEELDTIASLGFDGSQHKNIPT